MPERGDVEEIKRLKARYFRLLDAKHWDEWGELFTEDLRAEIHGPHPVLNIEGREEMVASVRESLAEAPTVHHGHMPEIEITGADTASGIWAMVDVVNLGAGFTGYGHYHEEYRKVAGSWRISSLRLTRLHIEPH